MKTTSNQKKPNLICLLLLISFPSASSVLISPALPAISNHFHLSISYITNLITFYLIGYALGQLIYPPIANRYGRKKAIYVGIFIYLIATLICLFGIYINSLIVMTLGRFILALGASVGMIISFTIINDYYKPEQAKSIVSYTVLSYAFMPAIAIFVGGYITSQLSWVDCFYFYIFYGLLILFIGSLLPETLIKKDANAFNTRILIKKYYHGFLNKRIIIFALIFGIMSSPIYIMATDGPFIGINTIGLSAKVYSALFLVAYLGQFLGSLTAGKINKKLSSYQVIFIGYFAVALGSSILLISFLCHWINIITLIGSCFIIKRLDKCYPVF